MWRVEAWAAPKEVRRLHADLLVAVRGVLLPHLGGGADAAALRAKLCVSGAESGATRCVWANEFEISTLCDVLELTALIVDESAAEAPAPIARSRCRGRW